MTDERQIIDPAVFQRLRELTGKLQSIPNRHERGIVMIKACLTEGIVKGSLIVGVLTALGLNSKHVGRLLKQHAGGNADLHHWERGQDGTYRSLD